MGRNNYFHEHLRGGGSKKCWPFFKMVTKPHIRIEISSKRMD